MPPPSRRTPGPTDTPSGGSAEGMRADMQAVAAGDAEAFARIYDAAAARVFGLVRRVLRDEAQSEEVTQEVLLEVWRRAASYDPARVSPISWILTIAHRRAVDRVRSSQARSERDEVYESRRATPSTDPTAEAAVGRVDAEHVRRALSSLTDRQREAVELAFLDGLTHRMVSERLGIPMGTAKARIRDGLAGLRRTLSDNGTGGGA